MANSFMDKNKLNQKLTEELKKIGETIKKPVIFMIGATGVGKSSIINECFGIDISKTGVGKPVTQNTKSYHDEKLPLIIHDTKGYELSDNNHKPFLDEVVDYLKSSLNKPVDEQVHLIWYCISAGGHRITDYDLNIIRTIKNLNYQICVIFTKCDLVSENELKKLQNAIMNEIKVDIIPISTQIKIDKVSIGIKKLIEWSYNKLPEIVKIAFNRTQKINFELKSNESLLIISQHCLGAFGVGMVPLPFADAPILVANQMALIARILYLYDLDSLKEKVSPMLQTFLTSIVSVSAAWLVGEIIKCIPGIGTLAGGLINGTIAAAITGAMGIAVSKICYDISIKILEGNQNEVEAYLNNADLFQDIFKKEYEKIIKNKGKISNE